MYQHVREFYAHALTATDGSAATTSHAQQHLLPVFAATIAFALAMLTAVVLPASVAFADENATNLQAKVTATANPADNNAATAPSASTDASQDASQSNSSASNTKSSDTKGSTAGTTDTAFTTDAGTSADDSSTAGASDTTKSSASKATMDSKATKTAKRAKAPKVGTKTRPIADSSYSILNKANRSYSLATSSKKSDASFKHFTASEYQTFTLKYNADRKAYTIFVSGSKKYLYATGKSSRVKQGKTANSASAFWKIRKTSGGYTLSNAKTGRLMRGSSTKPGNGKKVVVGTSKGKCSRWDLYAVNSCKKVSSSTRLNRIVDHLIRTKTGSHDSNATKFRKMFNYMASNTFTYAHVSNQARPTYHKWSEKYALNMALKHRGNCFSYSSLFGYLARGCGYQTKIISGNVALGSSRVKHSWVICKVSGPVYASKPKASKHGAWHIFDPESVHDYGIPFNMGYYGATNHGTGVYQYSYPKLTE